MTGNALSTELATAELALERDGGGYSRDSALITRVRDLREQVSLHPAPKTRGEVVSGSETMSLHEEIAWIENLMVEDIAEYLKSEGIQRRYRQLIAQRDNVDVGTGRLEDWWVGPAQARKALPPSVTAEWSRSHGGFDASFMRLKQNLANLWNGLVEKHDSNGRVLDMNIPGDYAIATAKLKGFIVDLECLPQSVQGAIYAEAGTIGPGMVSPATQVQFDDFRAGGHGAEQALSMWGQEAPRMLGIAVHRIRRLQARPNPQDDKIFQNWWLNQLTARERFCAVWILATPMGA